jgi:hypothetical protein
MKRWLLGALVVLTLLLAGCGEAWKRSVKDARSEMLGMERVVYVYSQNGILLHSYKGRFDIDGTTPGKVKFELNGKRIIIYNALVVTEEL